jgi:hypothetical protein
LSTKNKKKEDLAMAKKRLSFLKMLLITVLGEISGVVVLLVISVLCSGFNGALETWQWVYNTTSMGGKKLFIELSVFVTLTYVCALYLRETRREKRRNGSEITED